MAAVAQFGRYGIRPSSSSRAAVNSTRGIRPSTKFSTSSSSSQECLQLIVPRRQQVQANKASFRPLAMPRRNTSIFSGFVQSCLNRATLPHSSTLQVAQTCNAVGETHPITQLHRTPSSAAGAALPAAKEERHPDGPGWLQRLVRPEFLNIPYSLSTTPFWTTAQPLGDSSRRFNALAKIPRAFRAAEHVVEPSAWLGGKRGRGQDASRTILMKEEPAEQAKEV